MSDAPIRRPSNRTSSRRVSDLMPGDRVMLTGIEVAVVQSNEPMVEFGALRYIDRGNQGARKERLQEPVYTHKVRLHWEREHLRAGIPNILVLPGDRHIALRDTN